MSQLIIPNKDNLPESQGLKEDLYVIERWSKTIGGGTYKSLTGPGETATPGDLTQNGKLTVETGLQVNGDYGLYANVVGGGGIALTDTGGGSIKIMEDTDGIFLVEEEGGGITLFDGAGPSPTLTPTPGIHLHEAGVYGIELRATSNGCYVYTADVLASLPAPPTNAPAWGLTQDGHIYFYPSGGPAWVLKV